MVRARPSLPQGHGEVLTRPAFDSWSTIMRRNRRRMHMEGRRLGAPLADLRDSARVEILTAAAEYSARLGVQVRAPGRGSPGIVMSGHQPELCHPGIWAKTFLMQRVCDEVEDVIGVNLVVDTDAFEDVTLVAPCLEPEVRTCRVLLAVGGADVCYACAPVPEGSEVDRFCESGSKVLGSLRAPAIGRHFRGFCAALRSALDDADNLGDLLTMARRRFESSAKTTYLELPVSRLIRTQAWTEFTRWLVDNARTFAEVYNAELRAYRRASAVRSDAQPFPDLVVRDDAIELPLWVLSGSHRATAWLRSTEAGWRLHAGESAVEMESESGSGLGRAAHAIAPKALVLTLFARVFGCDLFIHGVGGGRYDAVTDGVIRRLWGLEPPEYVVASLTMYLPIGAVLVREDAVAEARQRLNRFEHNPNELLDEAEFDTEEERRAALALAEEKAVLIESMAAADADKKALGARIREVNTELTRLLEPLGSALRENLATLERQQASAEILTDRSYPFCLWDPLEVRDKVR